jgi:bla regulator protein blaR1
MILLAIDSAVRALALGLAVGAALTLTGTRNLHAQRSVWTIVLMASLAMPFLAGAHIGPILRAPAETPILQTIVVSGTPAGPEWLGLGALYGLVAALLFCRYTLSLLRTWRIRRNARAITGAWTLGLDVRASARMRTPATLGSTILLPEEYTRWSAQKLAAVISHERSHVLGRDCYVLWLARLNVCVFWFSPLAWWLRWRLSTLAEALSDEGAVAVIGDRPAYAQILLEFAAQGAASDAAAARSAAVPMARPGVSARIERVLGGFTPSAAPRPWRRALIAAALLPAVAAAAALQFTPVRAAQAATRLIAAQGALEPRVTHWPLDLLAQYYPSRAKRTGVDGEVRIAVTLDASGQVTHTRVLTEEPPNMGFGPAAAAVAWQMQYSNPTGRPAKLAVRVKFQLSRRPGGR